jgi:ribulose-bisphosphate carboxylase large chain
MAPFGGQSPIVPVFSSGQWGAQAPDMYGLLKSVDLMHLAGGGIIGHPDGIAAGVASMREAWDAAVAGVDLGEYAESRPALKRALAQFSGR